MALALLMQNELTGKKNLNGDMNKFFAVYY